jgi:hypothetical protein
MNKILTFLRSFQNSPLFANLAIHALGGYAIVFTLGVRFPSHRFAICVWGVLAAAFKEFFYDHRYELPPQPYPNAAQDFYGYMIGGALAILMWLVV